MMFHEVMMCEECALWHPVPFTGSVSGFCDRFQCETDFAENCRLHCLNSIAGSTAPSFGSGKDQ